MQNQQQEIRGLIKNGTSITIPLQLIKVHTNIFDYLVEVL